MRVQPLRIGLPTSPLLRPLPFSLPALRKTILTEAAGTSRADQFSAGLTGIRALAAMMVLAFHLFVYAGPRVLSVAIGDTSITYHWLITCGWMGANVFFVLSGFLLAIPFVKHIEGSSPPVAMGAYLRRRIRRVVPAYWAQMGILVAVLYLSGAIPEIRVIFMHLVFLQNFNHGDASALNGVYWTLPTEFGYYLLLPLFALGALRFNLRRQLAWRLISVLLIAFAIAYRVFAYQTVVDQSVDVKAFTLMQLPGLIDHFAVGMLFAWAYVHTAGTLSDRQADLIAAVGGVGIVCMMKALDSVYLLYWDGHWLLFLGYSLTAIFIGMVVLGVASAGPRSGSRFVFANPVMLYLGIISYSLYLWHLPIQQWTVAMLDRFGIVGDRLWWLVGISIPLSLIAATLSYCLVERPFLSHSRKA